jgi:DNA-directed RNA polymerase subunit RPC12/RpoP
MTESGRFSCPGCGAQLEWAPGEDALTCPHCGHVAKATSPEEPSEAPVAVKEHRIEDALARATRGWGSEKRGIECTSCGAISEIDPAVTATSCPFCDSHQLVQHEDDPNVIRPESLLPFSIPRDEALGRFRAWLKSLWFRPNALKSTAQIESLAGVYVPAWTFDCHTDSRWNAEAGYHYYVTETRTITENGKQVERSEQVRKTRWEPASGTHEGVFDDWIVQASKGLDQAALKRLQPFDTKALRPYDAAYLQGFQAERYTIDLLAAWQTGQREIDSEVTTACSKLVPGDEHRNLRVDTRFFDVTFKHVLLPIWIAAYRFNGKAFRYLVNGQTGRAHGTAPYSVAKIAAFVAAILLTIVIVAVCAGALHNH